MCYRVWRRGGGQKTETRPTVFRSAGAGTSLRILAGAVILLFFYYAAGVVITLLLSILLAYFLDPAVELLERVHIPRTIGALLMVLLLIGVLGAVGYGLWVRTQDFASNWPTYRGILRDATGSVQKKISGFEGSVTDLTSTGDAAKSTPAPRTASATV